jgi:Uma2 family endonuclease
MAESGVLRDGERLELLDGIIVEMSPIGSRHAACVTDLSEWLIARLKTAATVRVQNPLRLSERSERQPDIAVVRRRPDRYRSGHPGPDDIFLLIDVSDRTLAPNHEVKLPLYAAAGVLEVWIVNLLANQVDDYRAPEAHVYARHESVDAEATVSPLAFPRLRLPVREMVGR